MSPRHPLLMPNRVLRNAVFLQRRLRKQRLLAHAKVSLEHRSRHGDAFVAGRVAVPAIPPVPADHDGQLRAGGGVLARGGVGVEDDAEGPFGILLKGDGAGDQIAEAAMGEHVGSAEVEVHDHDGHGRGLGEDGEVRVFGEGREVAASYGAYHTVMKL